MTKRISAIALTISLCAAVYGLFFESDKSAYELKNGPPLVTSGFGARVMTALNADPQFYKAYGISPASIGARVTDRRYPSYNGPSFLIRNHIDNHKEEYLMVSEFANGLFNLNIQPFIWSNGDWCPKGESQTYSIISKDDLNKLIDKRVFPNPKTRKAKKIGILNRIEELNRKPTTSAKVSATVNWRRFSLN